MELEPNWSTTQNLEVCSHCKGSGVYTNSECVDYHRNDYDYWKELCSNCDGDGRVVRTTYSCRLSFKTPDLKSTNYQDLEKSVLSKLAGRNTSDIYSIGRRKS